MSAKTKIVVVKMRHIIFSGILLGAAILILILFLTMAFKQNEPKPEVHETGMFNPGVYTTSVAIGGAAIDVSVIVDDNNINSIRLENLSDTVETMYPLVEPAMDEIVSQVIEKQSTENITYSENNQYTSMILISAIDNTLKKAKTSQ